LQIISYKISSALLRIVGWLPVMNSFKRFFKVNFTMNIKTIQFSIAVWMVWAGSIGKQFWTVEIPLLNRGRKIFIPPSPDEIKFVRKKKWGRTGDWTGYGAMGYLITTNLFNIPFSVSFCKRLSQDVVGAYWTEK
jgi:hypothetical protein